MIGLALLSSGQLSTKMTYHNAGYTLFLMCYLKHKYKQPVVLIDEKKNSKHDYLDYDRFYLTEGANYNGTMNFFGGIQPHFERGLSKVIDRFTSQRHVSFIDLTINLKETVEKRLKCSFLYDIPTEKTDHQEYLIAGDSHSLSLYYPSYGLEKIDGLTLYNLLKDDDSWYRFRDLKEFVLYAGNIDVRFNADRYGGLETMKLLVEGTKDRLFELQKHNVKTFVCDLLPIESEQRKISKSLHHKKTKAKYHGSFQDRLAYVNYFNQHIKDDRLHHITWPFDYNLCLDPFMERSKSVHLAPLRYPHYEYLMTYSGLRPQKTLFDII